MILMGSIYFLYFPKLLQYLFLVLFVWSEPKTILRQSIIDELMPTLCLYLSCFQVFTLSTIHYSLTFHYWCLDFPGIQLHFVGAQVIILAEAKFLHCFVSNFVLGREDHPY